MLIYLLALAYLANVEKTIFCSVDCYISIHTFACCPWQRVLERNEHVEEAPYHYNDIVNAHNVGYYSHRDSDTNKCWGNLSPSANSSTVEFMAKTKFQVKQWQALNEKHNEIWNKKST
jgi:hypothetical protein